MESAVHPDRHLPGHLSPLTAPGRAAGDRSGLFGGVRGGSGQGGLQRLRPPPTGWNGRPGPTLADRWRPKPTRSTGRPGGRGPPRGIAARHGIVCFFWFWAGKGHAAQRSGPRPGNEVFALRDRTGTGRCPVVAASAGFFRPWDFGDPGRRSFAWCPLRFWRPRRGGCGHNVAQLGTGGTPPGLLAGRAAAHGSAGEAPGNGVTFMASSKGPHKLRLLPDVPKWSVSTQGDISGMLQPNGHLRALLELHLQSQAHSRPYRCK